MKKIRDKEITEAEEKRQRELKEEQARHEAENKKREESEEKEKKEADERSGMPLDPSVDGGEDVPCEDVICSAIRSSAAKITKDTSKKEVIADDLIYKIPNLGDASGEKFRFGPEHITRYREIEAQRKLCDYGDPKARGQ